MKRLRYIGQVAQETGIPQKTLRYYEELGLLPQPMRTESGYRIYTPDTLERVAFIKKAQRLGLTLSEIKQILDLYDKKQARCSHIENLLHRKIAEIDTQIQDLLALQQDLRGLLHQWEPAAEGTSKEEVICSHIQRYVPISQGNVKKKGGKSHGT